ncbi:MAG: hypothetical protein ACI4F9_12060 [Lachnospiraceae bacterium]
MYEEKCNLKIGKIRANLTAKYDDIIEYFFQKMKRKEGEEVKKWRQ